MENETIIETIVTRIRKDLVNVAGFDAAAARKLAAEARLVIESMFLSSTGYAELVYAVAAHGVDQGAKWLRVRPDTSVAAVNAALGTEWLLLNAGHHVLEVTEALAARDPKYPAWRAWQLARLQ